MKMQTRRQSNRIREFLSASTRWAPGKWESGRWTLGVLILLALAASGFPAAADDWPQWRGPARDGVWRESGLVDHFDGAQIPIRWRVPIASGYSGPTVAKGRVYVTDRLTEPTQVERVHCFDWKTGDRLWTHSYACDYRDVSYVAGPRASVLVHEGLAYSLGTMGNLHCFDAASGEVRWALDLGALFSIRMPIWGIASSPIVVGDALILQIGGSPGACVVALDRQTGREMWRALDDQAGYSAPILIDQAGVSVLVCWTGDSVNGLDPVSGAVRWRFPFPPKEVVLSVATPVFAAGRLFFTGFYDGALMLRADPDTFAVEEVWRRRGASELETDGLHSIISTPVIDGDHIYGIDSYGELRCLTTATGERVWESQEVVPRARWSTAHIVRNGERYWIFNERGELLIVTLSPQGVQIHSRAQLIQPTRGQLNQRGGVVWSHPAFAYRHIFARNDEELICASLAAR